MAQHPGEENGETLQGVVDVVMSREGRDLLFSGESLWEKKRTSSGVGRKTQTKGKGESRHLDHYFGLSGTVWLCGREWG